MSDSVFYITLIGYWVVFFWNVFRHPFSLCYGETLDYEFTTFRLCGEYWRKFKIPQDPCYFKDFAGSRQGIYYPVNIIFSYIASFFKIDTAWRIHVFNILFHSLLTSFFAYHLFGKGLIGLFGALAWGYCAWHIKTQLYYVQGFTWITAALYFVEHLYPIQAGISLGLLLLCGHPLLVGVLCVLLPFLAVFKGLLTISTPLIAFTIGFPQIWAVWKYRKKAVGSTLTYEEKVKVGSLPVWVYAFMFLPIRIREKIAGLGFEEWNFYVTPLIGFFALFGRGDCWVLLAVAVCFSLGRSVFKLFSKFLPRFPHRFGYFAMLAIIVLGVDGLRRFNLPDKQLILLNVFLGLLLWFNRDLIHIHPFSQWTKKPSQSFETPLLKFLEENSKGYRVNNLPFPVYTGQINHIKTCGYTGGNHSIKLGQFLNIPKMGIAPYNWFDWRQDGELLDWFQIKYHIGKKPLDPKWIPTKFDNLWENTKAWKLT